MARTLLYLTILANLLAYAVCAPSMSGLRVVGNQIRNKDNQVVRLNGVNRSGMEWACVKMGALSDGPMDQNSITAMMAWNINSVRVPLNEDCWLGINGVSSNLAGSNYISAVQAYVNLLTTNNLAVILDLHWSAAGSTLALQQDDMPNQDHSLAFWTGVATTFKGYSNVIFDLFNEPKPLNAVWDSTAAWNCWLNGGASACQESWAVAGMQSLVNTVRATGATNPLLVNGIAWSNSLAEWMTYKPTDPLNNLIAGAHIYNFNFCADLACFNQYIAPITLQYPVLFGEIGENDCGSSFINMLTSWADSNGVSYMAWTWNTWDCATGPALISSYDGTPTAFGAGYKAILLAKPSTLGTYSSTSSGASSSSSSSATSGSSSSSGGGGSVAPPPSSSSTGSSCNPSSVFPASLNNRQCQGLNQVYGPTSAAQCAQAACGTSASVWQWCQPGYSCSPPSSCWTGPSTNCATTPNSGSGWVSQAIRDPAIGAGSGGSTSSTTSSTSAKSSSPTTSTSSKASSTSSTTGRPSTTTGSATGSSTPPSGTCGVTVSTSVSSTWHTGTQQQGQVNVQFNVPAGKTVTALTFSIAGTIVQTWNMSPLSAGSNSFTLPSYSFPLRAGNTVTPGFVYGNSVGTITVLSASC